MKDESMCERTEPVLRKVLANCLESVGECNMLTSRLRAALFGASTSGTLGTLGTLGASVRDVQPLAGPSAIDAAQELLADLERINKQLAEFLERVGTG